VDHEIPISSSEGAKGEILGTRFAFVGDFEKCPKLDALIKASGEETAEIKTPALKVDRRTRYREFGPAIPLSEV
jgi:hypothetical protein